MGDFFSDPNHAPQTVAALLEEYMTSVQSANPLIKSWAILGVSLHSHLLKSMISSFNHLHTHNFSFEQFCWGGKVAAFTTSDRGKKLFDIAAVAHPAMVDPTEADGISVPYLLLASGEEEPSTIKDFEARLKVPHLVETFADQVHGWMAARADLSNEHVKKEYARGYGMVLDFLKEHWV